jgi:hypothetical protein
LAEGLPAVVGKEEVERKYEKENLEIESPQQWEHKVNELFHHER